MRRTSWILFCNVRDLIKGGRFYIEISFRLFGIVRMVNFDLNAVFSHSMKTRERILVHCPLHTVT